MENFSEDMITDEAEAVSMEDDIIWESDAEIPEESFTDELPENEGAIESEVPDILTEVQDEQAGREPVSEVHNYIFDVSVVWPDGAVTKRSLTYEGSGAEDIEACIGEAVSADLGQIGIFESEYTCAHVRNEEKSTVETTDTIGSDGDVIGTTVTTTDWYDVTVTTIQPVFTENEGDVQALAHRAADAAPENTLAGFRLCAVKGFHYIGADIHFTSDGVPVLLHDVSLNRTCTTDEGVPLDKYTDVEKITYSEVLTYDTGIIAGSFWKGERIATFEQFMQLCYKLNFIPNIHIKSSLYMTKARLATLVDIAKENGMQGRVVWAADDIDYLRFIQSIDPISGLDLVVFKWTPTIIENMKALKTDTNFVEVAIVKSVYKNSMAVTCALNGVYCTAAADTEEEVKALDSSVRLISTDELDPDMVVEWARSRESMVPETCQVPEQATDYTLLACDDVSLMFTIKSSALGAPMLLNKAQSYDEMNDFRFTKLADGYYQVLNTRSMLALEVKNGSTAAGSPVVLGTWDASAKQRWKIVKNANGSVTLVNKASGMAIMSKDGKIAAKKPLVQAKVTGTDSQQFWMVKAARQVKVDFTKTYYLTTYSNAGITAGIEKNSTASKANVCLVTKSNHNAMKFKLYYSGDGYYRIMNMNSKQFLTVVNNSTADGANVIQDTWRNVNGQRWMVKQNKNGSYTLVCKTGTCLQVSSNIIAAGTNINVGSSTGNVLQCWKLAAV